MRRDTAMSGWSRTLTTYHAPTGISTVFVTPDNVALRFPSNTTSHVRRVVDLQVNLIQEVTEVLDIFH